VALIQRFPSILSSIRDNILLLLDDASEEMINQAMPRSVSILVHASRGRPGFVLGDLEHFGQMHRFKMVRPNLSHSGSRSSSFRAPSSRRESRGDRGYSDLHLPYLAAARGLTDRYHELNVRIPTLHVCSVDATLMTVGGRRTIRVICKKSAVGGREEKKKPTR